ncbi:hypothetical protein QBC45DRAFT_392019 [Copromyces sp. CBS 386.78]|nr:hypothetical protein QBC45DRAFT_392019 [Copromyces sp. CBS 386.78]
MSIARVRFLAVEAVFTALFHACLRQDLDDVWGSFLPWKRDAVSWLPLCSHSALMERPQGITDLTGKELEAYNAARRKRAKENTAKNSKAAEEREKRRRVR